MSGGLFQVPAEVVKVETKANRSLRIVCDTQENMTDENMARVMALYEKYGHWVFLPDEREVQPEDVVDLPPLPKREDEKSPAQRLRAVLFVYFKQKGEPGDFESFYNTQVGRFIEAIKEKLT